MNPHLPQLYMCKNEPVRLNLTASGSNVNFEFAIPWIYRVLYSYKDCIWNIYFSMKMCIRITTKIKKTLQIKLCVSVNQMQMQVK